MRTHDFEFTGVKGGFMSPGETFNQKIKDKVGLFEFSGYEFTGEQKIPSTTMLEGVQTYDEMSAKLIDHATSIGCYVSSILVSTGNLGLLKWDIVLDEILLLFDEHGGDLNSTVHGMLELFNWGIRDQADVHKDIDLIISQTQKSQMTFDRWENLCARTKGNAETFHNPDGNLTFSRGDYYVGEYKDDKQHGQGTFISEENGKYVGQLRDGLRSGYGTLTFATGTTYAGEWKNGQQSGQGKFKYNDEFHSGDRLYDYVGEFKNGLRSGQGTLTFDGGSRYKYIGEWKDDKPNGQGTLIFANGDEYVGEFKDGKRHGQGTIINAEGGKYVGEFKDGVAHGQGTDYFADGCKYEGEWKDGAQSGQGTYTFPDGTNYVGEFKGGVPNGQGTQKTASGDNYVGEWKDGMRCGQGTYTEADGKKTIGIWKDNAPLIPNVSSLDNDDIPF